MRRITQGGEKEGNGKTAFLRRRNVSGDLNDNRKEAAKGKLWGEQGKIIQGQEVQRPVTV